MRKVTILAAVLTCGALALAAPAAYAKGGGGHGGGGHGGGHGGHSSGHHGGHSGGHHGGHYSHHGGSYAHHHHGYRGGYGGYGGYGYGGYGGYGYNNYGWFPWYGSYGYPGYGYGSGSGYGNYGNYYPNSYYSSGQNFMTCPNGQCPAGMQNGTQGFPNGLPQNPLPQMTTISQQQPAPAGTPAPLQPNQLKIRNPRDSRGALTYVLNGMPYKIEPGQAQVLDASRNWVISFNRGPGMTNAVYTLSSGMTYAFSVSAQGWELTSQP